MEECCMIEVAGSRPRKTATEFFVGDRVHGKNGHCWNVHVSDLVLLCGVEG